MSDPITLRNAVLAYVDSVHGAYGQAVANDASLDFARGLIGQPFTVAVVAHRHLHFIATRDALPGIPENDIPLQINDYDVQWRVRFYDQTILDGLSNIDESVAPQHDSVREILGIVAPLYHVAASPGSGLSRHHGEHTGTALANTQPTSHISGADIT